MKAYIEKYDKRRGGTFYQVFENGHHSGITKNKSLLIGMIDITDKVLPGQVSKKQIDMICKSIINS